MSFRKVGGVQYSATQNVVKNRYNTSDNLYVTQYVGEPNTVIDFLSDISGNITIYGDLVVSGDAYKPGGGTWSTTSDIRLKEDIEIANIELCYSNIKKLKLKYWKWRDDVDTFSKTNIPNRHKLGWIAQDVLQIMPKSVTVTNSYGIEDCLGLDCDQIYATLYGAVEKIIVDKELLEEKVTKQQDQINWLINEINELKSKST